MYLMQKHSEYGIRTSLENFSEQKDGLPSAEETI